MRVFSFLWDVRGYFFWLLVVSALCLVLERIWPWRRDQKVLRPQLAQDVVWLVWNGHFAGMAVAWGADWLLGRVYGGLHVPSPESLRLLSATPPGVQFVLFFVFKDFMDWCGHNVLHRVGWLWEFHKVHHSIVELDWIGNFRFHWFEVVFYKSLTYLPLVALGVDRRVILWIAVLSTLIGHLNHANLRADWGPLRWIFNSPRMHAWHHDAIPRGGHGKNFAIIFSAWDWIFGTAFLPGAPDQPEQLGFAGIEHFPRGFLSRMAYPLTRRSR